MLEHLWVLGPLRCYIHGLLIRLNGLHIDVKTVFFVFLTLILIRLQTYYNKIGYGTNRVKEIVQVLLGPGGVAKTGETPLLQKNYEMEVEC